MSMGLKDKLLTATGNSHHIIALSIDIRNFSKFSQNNDSADVALFISKFYLELIERFNTITEDYFYKSTGDGLMICIQYTENNLKERFNEVIQVAISCHQEFESMFTKLKIINFNTPTKIGIGISRGSACAIVTKNSDIEEIIDYSGHKLNLASRLQDIARPSGIIFENISDLLLLDKDISSKFTGCELYIRSIAEKNPITACVFNDYVVIKPENLKPLVAKWSSLKNEFSKKELLKSKVRFHLYLKNGKIIPNSISVKLIRVAILNRDGYEGTIWRDLNAKVFSIVEEGDNNIVMLHLSEINEKYKEFIEQARWKDSFTFEVLYRILEE